jgi:hypothetical protein
MRLISPLEGYPEPGPVKPDLEAASVPRRYRLRELKRGAVFPIAYPRQQKGGRKRVDRHKARDIGGYDADLVRFDRAVRIDPATLREIGI